MPAAIYEYCRTRDHKSIRVGGGFVLPTDRQTQDHMLCDDCEDVLNSGGETWVLDKLATRDRDFPLYALLSEQPPDLNDGELIVYFALKNPKIEVWKLTHFALGIFWKASVHSWISGRTEPQINLGPYSETMRLWLRGESPFPDYLYLVCVVARPPCAKPLMTLPYEGQRSGWRTFNFCVPGVAFMLNVGKTVDDALRTLCIHFHPMRPIVVADWLSERFESVFTQQFHSARKTESFLRSMEKIKLS